MNQPGTSVTAFEALRSRLFGLAYRMLGSRAEAQDIVQEAYVRWHEVEHGRVDSPEAWLVTTTSRLAIDRLRRLNTEREAYVGPWLPEPIVTKAPPPDRNLDLAADLSIAFLTLLERLAPDERAAFLSRQWPMICCGPPGRAGGSSGRSSFRMALSVSIAVGRLNAR